MKRKGILRLCCVLLIFACITTSAFAGVDQNATTLKDVESTLNQYIENTYSIEPGSSEYVEFLTNQLMFREDSQLTTRPDYDELELYAGIYLSEVNSPESTVIKDLDNGTQAALLNDEFLAKSLDQAKKEIESSNLEDLQGINQGGVSPFAAYSPSKAADYAMQYWEDYNTPEYPKFGSDCTNFVSQCAKAGGKAFKKPTDYMSKPAAYENNNYWYSHHYLDWQPTHKYKQSTSFIRVKDFYTYWKNHGATVINCSTNSALRDKIKVGDIVQLADSSGSWFHSIIISCKKDGSWRYAAHTSNHKWKTVSSIIGASKYRIIRL